MNYLTNPDDLKEGSQEKECDHCKQPFPKRTVFYSGEKWLADDSEICEVCFEDFTQTDIDEEGLEVSNEKLKVKTERTLLSIEQIN